MFFEYKIIIACSNNATKEAHIVEVSDTSCQICHRSFQAELRIEYSREENSQDDIILISVEILLHQIL